MITQLKTFTEHEHTRSATYESINQQINTYAEENNLCIIDVQYDKINYSIVANVLFSEIPKEIWVC